MVSCVYILEGSELMAAKISGAPKGMMNVRSLYDDEDSDTDSVIESESPVDVSETNLDPLSQHEGQLLHIYCFA